VFNNNVQFQKISILPAQKGVEFPGGGRQGSVRPKRLKKCMKLNWNFQRGLWWGCLRKIPFHGRGMVIFWNYTMRFKPESPLWGKFLNPRNGFCISLLNRLQCNPSSFGSWCIKGIEAFLPRVNSSFPLNKYTMIQVILD